MVSNDDAEGLFQPAGPAEVVGDELSRILLSWVMNAYGMTEREVAALLDQACCAYLTVGVRVTDPRSWIIGAVLHGANTHQRLHALPEKTNDVEAEIARIHRLVLTTEAVAVLSEPVRAAIRMRFFEEKSYAEIAAELGVAAHYARHLVMQGVAKLSALRRGR